MQGICKLCGSKTHLQFSHILPAFVFRWLRESGHIRRTGEPNLRVQDGPKKYWLCKTCEAVLSEWEDAFASNVFYPTNSRGIHLVRYGNWLLKFCVSISWRVLLYIIETRPLTHLSQIQLHEVDKALDVWKRFLLAKDSNPGKFEQHIILLDRVTDATGFNLPPNTNRYFIRGVEIDVAASETTAFVFSKLGRIVILGFIQLKHSKRWRTTRLSVSQGYLGGAKITLPIEFGEYIFGRARKGWEATKAMSPKQQEKVAATILSSPDKYVQSQAFQTMQYDLELFGSQAFQQFNETDDVK